MPLTNSIVPLCFSIIALVIASPNPAPPVDDLLALSSLTKASNILSLTSSLIPLPSSEITISIPLLHLRDIIVKVVFLSLYLYYYLLNYLMKYFIVFIICFYKLISIFFSFKF